MQEITKSKCMNIQLYYYKFRVDMLDASLSLLSFTVRRRTYAKQVTL